MISKNQKLVSNSLPPLTSNVVVIEESSTIYFYSKIDPVSILRLNSQILSLTNEIRRTKSLQENQEDSSSITLHLNSLGGDVASGLAGMDTILTNRVSIDTLIEGEASSAATLLSVAGRHRMIRRHSLILIHQLNAWVEGTFEEMKEEVYNLTKLHKILRGIYLERTKIPVKMLDQEFFKKNVWLSAKEALKLGIVDEIV